MRYLCFVLGIIEKIQQIPCHESRQVKQRCMCSPTDHFISQGHNCGFRNLQMLLSCLINDAAYVRQVFSGRYRFLLATAWSWNIIAMHKHGVCRHAVCVCVSVTFLDHVKTNIGNFEIFSPTDSHTILVFPCQTAWQYSNGNPPHGGIECSWGRQKSRFWAYLALVPAVSAATCQLLSTGSPVDDVTVSQVMTHCW